MTYGGLQLAKGFAAFDAEAKALTDLIPYTGARPRVMGLIFNTTSHAMTHPLYLHSSTVLARARGGVTNFSFALTPHSPLMYRGAPPPTFPSEWRPDQMNWDTQGSWYDHFVVRGVNPRQIFGARLDNELVVAAQSWRFLVGEETMTIDEAESLSAGPLAELLAAEVKEKRSDHVEALASSKKKDVARAARKALYQLKSSGVAVTAPPQAPAVSTPSVPAETKELPSLMSSILGTGERALFFVKPLRGGGLEMYQVIVHDELGIQQLDHGETSRQAYRQHLRQVRGDTNAVIEVSLERVLEELGVAWGISIRAKTALKPEAESYLRRLNVTPRESWPPLPAIEPADAPLVTRAGHLHDEPEISMWLPSSRRTSPGAVVQRLDEVDASPIELSEKKRNSMSCARKEGSSRSPARCPLRHGASGANRLWRMAEVFEQTWPKPIAAQIARAEAHCDSLHEPSTPSRFLEGLLENELG